MFAVFEEVSSGNYKRTVTKSSAKRSRNQLAKLTFNKDGMPEIRGVIIESDQIVRLEDVPVITPNCDIVVPSLTLTVRVFYCCVFDR